MGFLDNVKKIENIENGLHVIMGEPGIGKTTFAGTYPKPILYVSLGNDGGYKVLGGNNDIDMIPPLSTDNGVYKAGNTTGKRMYDKLAELLGELFQAKDHGYKTLIIDPITELQEDLCYFIKKKKGKNLSFDEWGQIGDMMADLFKKLEYLAKSMNIVLICHTKTIENTDSMSGNKVTRIIPAFTENTAKRICKNADMVAWIGAKTVTNEDSKIEGLKRYIVVGANPLLPTKIRLPLGKSLDGEEIFDLTYEGLQEIIKSL